MRAAGLRIRKRMWTPGRNEHATARSTMNHLSTRLGRPRIPAVRRTDPRLEGHEVQFPFQNIEQLLAVRVEVRSNVEAG